MSIVSIHRGPTRPHDRWDVHTHREPLLMWSSTATVAVSSAARDWLVPPGHGIWVPADTEHSASTVRGGEVSVVRFAPGRSPVPWRGPTGVALTPLLHELAGHLEHIGADDASRPHAEALFVALLGLLPTHDLPIAMPTDPRTRIIAERLLSDPADPRGLAAWADHVHAGARTLSRLFLQETGLTFARWRAQVRIRAAVAMLADGAAVDTVARAVGYRKTSAFIAAFRRATGHTPGAFQRAGTSAVGIAPSGNASHPGWETC
ncbi:DNA-binding domain-containing protein, AraC-type [Nostocoides japonicum T1-X7]|uniref:HTH-type transcriptional regulator RipA n=1 Tax=Nostocoides japonicum T1-X7 TaxID=1194083 RepID=A0A077LUX5_9MICO|nr:AraC family transcriptional regulator [Tetrasphaera japonica]CCH77708.1 DNA-binding domain-containing protein, AraC-type [Tetrasphaera japonica T1-X7]